MSITNNAVTGGAVRPFCFTLWYIMRADGYVGLNVTAIGPDNKLASFIHRDEDQGDKWNQLQFETPGDKNGYIYTISAVARLGMSSVFEQDLFSNILN